METEVSQDVLEMWDTDPTIIILIIEGKGIVEIRDHILWWHVSANVQVLLESSNVEISACNFLWDGSVCHFQINI